MHVGEIFYILIVIWTPCILSDRWDDQETRRFVQEYIPKLQHNLRRAGDDSDENDIISKIISKNNRHYDIHLIKLRNVNGLKTHNLIVKERSDDNPLIYVINPVETKIPHAFVSEKEFKDILNNRGKKQRNEVYTTKDPMLPLPLPVNATYWTKLTSSDPTLISIKIHHQNSFKRRQQNTKPVVTTNKTKNSIRLEKNSNLRNKRPPIPYIHYLRTKNSKAKTNKTQYLRNNRTRKVKTYKPQYFRNNRTSKVKTYKHQYLRSNKTSNATRIRAITLKKKSKIKAKIIYLSNNRSKTNKKILRNISAKPTNQTVSHIFKKEHNMSILEKISKAKIIVKHINEAIEKQTTKEIVTEISTIENELPPVKNEVASTTEVFFMKKQSTEEVTLEKPKNLDLTTEKLKTAKETKKYPEKTIIENTGDSKTEGETKEVPTDSEITTKQLITEDKITKEPTNTETVNIEHSKEEDLMATEKTPETPATDITNPFDNTDNNTESVNTEDQKVDLATDQSKFEETTVRRPLPFRTTVFKRTTTKARIRTTRSRLSRPLVFMGETGNGNSWN